MTVVDEALPQPPDEPTPDTEFTSLVERLGPAFLEVARAAVAESIAAVPTPTFRPAEVQGVDADARTASVLIDGDTAPISAQVLTELPAQYDRVMVTFVPPSSVFVVGFITAPGLQAGFVAPYVGPVTHHPGAETGATSGAPPRGWLWCAGQAVDRARYSALFRAIGTQFGAGNGTTTFNVPDLRGRALVGLDNMGGTDAGRIGTANTIGATAGAETHTLSTGNLPSHNHDLGGHTHSFTPSGSVSITSVGGSVSITGTTSSDGAHNHGVAFSGNIGNAGGVNGNFAGSDRDYASSFDGAHSHSFSGSGSVTGGYGSGSFSGYAGTTGGPSGASGYAGSGGSVNHMPPHSIVHWLIKT